MKRRILKVDEKHDTRLFDAEEVGDLRKACVKILKERLEYGYYHVGERPADPPEGATESRKSIIVRSQKAWDAESAFLLRVKECVLGPGSLTRRGNPLAYYLLSLRTHYEYQRVSLVYLEEV